MNCKHCNSSSLFKYGYCRDCFFSRRLICINTGTCMICDKHLRHFRTRKDWASRYLHKSCYSNN